MEARILALVRAGALALVTPLMEKNPAKTFAAGVPFVFSMSRAIVLAFAIGALRQMCQGGVRGWPEATLAIAIVLALPLLGALDRVRPSEVLQLTRALFGRFGIGAVSMQEPSKFDDHREDT
jgi:hypothetical protein